MSIETLLLILRLTGFLIGGTFLYFTWSAYRRHKTSSMLILIIATAMWMVSIVIEGFAIQGLGVSIDHAHILESIVMIVASSFLLLSVLSHKIKEWE